MSWVCGPYASDVYTRQTTLAQVTTAVKMKWKMFTDTDISNIRQKYFNGKSLPFTMHL